MEDVRPAVAEDVAPLALLVAAARAAAGGRRGGPELIARWDPAAGVETALRAWRTDPDRLVLAGTFEGAVVGVAVGRIGAAGPDGTVGVVDCCYVDPPAREVGVGEALARALLEWFAGRGCTAADVAALPGDRATKQLFENLGFSARLLVLHRRLR